jgi:hypothetical protein
MMKHQCGNTFDYVLSLTGVEPTEFVGWNTRCQIRDSQGRLIDEIDSEWVNPAQPIALSLFKMDTTGWNPGFASLNVQFIRIVDGYTRSLEDPLEWELEKDSFR